jgi:transposase
VPPVEQLYADYLHLRQENTALRAQIDWLKKELFAGGKSERFDRAQMLLELEAMEAAKARAESPVRTVSYERAATPSAPRQTPAEAFADVPVAETITIEPEEVKNEPQSYEKIGEERTFEIDVVPPRLIKREFVRPKYRRRDDRTRAPVLAPAPARPVPGGYASAGLLAWIAISKYQNHLPLYRLEKMSAHWGATLSRQSMAEWVRITAELCEPIHRCMLQVLLKNGYVQCDETPVRCHDPDNARGGTVQAWLWVVSEPDGDVVFDWRMTRRHGELPRLIGESWSGLLQSDGYEAYAAYARTHQRVTWLGCWAHARRKFFDAQAENPKLVRVALKLIGRLYLLERRWDHEDEQAARVRDADARAALRRTHFARSLRWLHALAVRTAEGERPKSLLGRACRYLLAHWKPLCAHLDHGRTRIDNNLVENAIRPSCIGKKNWLFIGDPRAGQRSAVLYSLIVSCERHGKDPLAYLRDVLTRLPAMTNQDDISVLIPANWQPRPN